MTKILIILHQKHSTPGRIGEALIQRGYTLDMRRPRYGDPLPATMDDHAGAIIFGGPMSANDNLDYINIETDWIKVPLRDDKPFLGVCLGAQMLAQHLGAKVRPNKDGCVEVGYYPIQPTFEGRSRVSQWPGHVYQWHREGFDLPLGATLLAKGNLFRNQAIAFGENAYGVQFHPEVTLAMMNRWTRRGVKLLQRRCAQPKGLHFYDRMRFDNPIERWMESFLDNWLKQHPAIHQSGVKSAPFAYGIAN